jgi:hypothetical protein
MGLINLKTDLKSLKYGKDRKGGGDSSQPYIKSNIPDGLSSSSPDFLLRNGYLNPVSTANDVSRLTQMFFDLKSPNGLLFIAKQNLLSRTAVATQTSGNGLNEGVYTPTNTLAQAGVNFLGLHLNKQGINPFELTGTYSNNNNLYDVRIKNYNQEWLLSPDGNLKNRLYALYDSKIQNNEIGGFAKTNNISNFSTEILTYNGGPGSNLGIGNTSIKFTDQRTGINNPLVISNPSYFTGSYKPVFEPGNYLKTLSNVKLNNGAFGKYSRLIGLNQSQYSTLQPYNNEGVLNYYFNVYNSGSLNPYGPIVLSTGSFSQTQRINSRTTSLFKSPLGVSFKWSSSTGYNDSVSNPKLTTGGGYTYELDTITSVYSSGSFPETTDRIYDNGTLVFDQEQLEAAGVINEQRSTPNFTPKTWDFRSTLRKNLKSSTIMSNAPSYYVADNKTIEGRVLLGDPGNKTRKNLISYTNGSGIGPVDKINALPIYRSQWATTEDDLKNDLVKFRIAAIDNDDPNFKNFMHFRAFLDSFSDAYTGDWGSTKYLGRGENFYNYTGFNRTISLSWTVAAQSKEELIPMYKKLNYLASNLMPDYSKSGYMRGPLMQMTVGGYLYEQVGFFTSLNYEIPAESPWEIGINDTGGEDRTVKELSHMIKVQASFTPIHDFVPSKQDLEFNNILNTTGSNGKVENYGGFVKGYGQQRFIALAVGSGSQYNNYDASSAYQVGNGKYTVT